MLRSRPNPFSIFCLLLAAAAAGVGCSSTPTLPHETLEVPRIMAQVDSAIQQAADPKNPNAPVVTSVQIDLEVGVSTNSQGQATLGIIAVGGSNTHESVHHISMTFVPTNNATQASAPDPKSPTSGLAAAIRAVYQAVPEAGPNYRFQSGSVKIQCTFKTETDGGLKTVALVPIEADASASKDSIQTITLIFDGSAAKNPAAGT